MEKVEAVLFLLAVGTVAEELNELHRWEEWGGQDDRKGVGV